MVNAVQEFCFPFVIIMKCKKRQQHNIGIVFFLVDLLSKYWHQPLKNPYRSTIIILTSARITARGHVLTLHVKNTVVQYCIFLFVPVPHSIHSLFFCYKNLPKL